MFYFLLMPSLTYHGLMILAAVLPAILLMIKVYRSDRLEKEDPRFLLRLALAGVYATLIALVAERIGGSLVLSVFSNGSRIGSVLLYFGVVGFSEEGAKYFMLKRRSWHSAEFNCQYDAVVYAAFISLGFALWENISYVLHYGFSAAVIRAVTAIPGHACFGVFMGVFYGIARSYAFLGDQERSRFYRVLSVVVPALIHGAYDYIASIQAAAGDAAFLVFIVILFAVSVCLINQLSKNDRYFRRDRSRFPTDRMY